MASKPTLPRTPEECGARGGHWGQHGLSDRCDLKTSDAGAACRDSVECEGLCLAPPGSREGGAVVGTCSAYAQDFSRQVLVERGRAREIIIE